MYHPPGWIVHFVSPHFLHLFYAGVLDVARKKTTQKGVVFVAIISF